jgi:hypothetical protein
MAWVSASMPVAAVSIFGMDAVSPGSHRATFAAILGCLMLNLNLSVVSVMTELKVTSLPVPDVVGMATRGSVSPVTAFRPS